LLWEADFKLWRITIARKTAELCLEQLCIFLPISARSLTTPTSPAHLAVRASATQQSTLKGFLEVLHI